MSSSSGNQSKYAIRMLKLSGRIFAEYNRPKMPREITREAMLPPWTRLKWNSHHHQNEMVVKRLAEQPRDFSPRRTPHYYPAHPQLKDLMATLRDHGLFRDEHQDIVEEMSRLRALRGKPDKPRGPKALRPKTEKED